MKTLVLKRKTKLILIFCFLCGFFCVSSCSYIIPEQSGEQQEPPVYQFPRQTISGQNNGIPRDISGHPETGESPENEMNSPPEAFFSVIPPTSHQAGMKIYFDAGASKDKDGDILAYYWDFGDGSPLFGPTKYNPVCHRYAKEGDYTVRLTVFDNAGNAGSLEKILHVGELTREQ